MKRLTRYILRQSFGATLFVTAALTAAIWLAQSLRLIDLIVNRGLSIELFLYLALLILPRFLDIVLPIAVFIAVLFTYNKLIGESEIIVMRAAGVSQIQLAKPAMILALLATALGFALSTYFLPLANRAFKDLQFEIRNQFASAVLQEGTFTAISDNLTVYVRTRAPDGEVTGLLVHDDRDRQKPVTLIAERGAFVDAGGGSRIVMANGNRQQFDRATGRLSVLSFDRYTLDLSDLSDAPGVRTPEPQERTLYELWTSREHFGDRGWRVEAHQRLITPLLNLSFAVIPLACLLSGEFNRRGQTRWVLLAVAVAFLFQAIDIGIRNVAGRNASAIPMMYVTALLPLFAGGLVLLRGVRPLGRVRAAARPA
jgi:lipopolysaccharide export system permease protein